MNIMKIYKNYNAAKTAANGREILRVDYRHYLVGDFEPTTQIEVIDPKGMIIAQVGVGHLKRLGNANWATAGK